MSLDFYIIMKKDVEGVEFFGMSINSFILCPTECNILFKWFITRWQILVVCLFAVVIKFSDIQLSNLSYKAFTLGL